MVSELALYLGISSPKEEKIFVEQILALTEEMKAITRRWDEDELERKRERQEREALYSSRQIDSSNSAAVTDPLDDKVTESQEEKIVSPSGSYQISSHLGAPLKHIEPVVEPNQPKTKVEERNKPVGDWESREEQKFNQNKRGKELSLVKIKQQKEEVNELIERKLKNDISTKSEEKNGSSTLMIQIPSLQVPDPVIDAVVCVKVAGDEESFGFAYAKSKEKLHQEAEIEIL